MSTQNVIFIDSRVSGYEALVPSFGPDTEWHLLNASEDGLVQTQRLLAEHTGLDSIQIISHGASGTLYLGSTVLNSQQLAHDQSQLQAIGGSLSANGDILLYGCNVGQGDAGLQFIQSLAQFTRADIAASNDLSGGTADSILEVSTGAIQATALDLAALPGRLGLVELISVAPAGVAGNSWSETPSLSKNGS